MITNMLIYEGAFVNIETTPEPENANIQQHIRLRIFDTETPDLAVPNNFKFIVSNNGDGTQTVSVFSDVFTDPGTEIFFGYDAGAGWVDTALNLNGRTSFVIPEGDYDYSVLVASDSGSPRYTFTPNVTTTLEMAETPITIKVIDNDEDKFKQIKSKQAEIQLHTSDEIGIETFAEGGDNRYYVEIETLAEGIIFKGFLSTSDLSEDFMPDPNILRLIATDGLGYLEDEPLVNFDNETPVDRHTVLDFIVWALAKTGLMLDVKVCMNIRETTAVPLISDADGAGHFYKFIYLDAKTFEDEIGTCESSFDVLEKILGENSFIVQYRGQWIILRPDEMETGHEYYFTRFNYQGTFVENTDETFTKNIGVGLPLSWMGDDAQIGLNRPYRKIIEKFNFNYPKELVCNIDYSRGDFVENLPDEVDPDGVTENVKKYTLDCWAWLSWEGGTFNVYANYRKAALPTADHYVKKFFVYDAETHRELVLKATPGSGNGVGYVQSSYVDVSYRDIISLSVSVFYSNIGGGTGFSNSPVLVGLFSNTDPDVVYWWQAHNTGAPDDPGVWTLSSVTSPAIPTGRVWPWFLGANVEDPPLEMSYTSPPLPISGRLCVFLINAYGDEVQAHYGIPNLTIRPFVNGGYEIFEAQVNSVSQDNSKVKAVREKEVFISDAPRIAMKGALLKLGGGMLLYSGDASFGTAGQFEVDGNLEGLFPIGTQITIAGSVSNNITGYITDLNYSIIGDVTTIFTDAETVAEGVVAITVTEITYQLAGPYYNAALLTSGPGPADVMPFGRLQSFDVWNQFNRVMRTFEGTVDRTDSALQLPDLLHKYIMQDINANTTNGNTQYRIFMLLHFDMNLHLCEWAAFFHEVFNTADPKTYETSEFKFITADNA